MYSGIGVILAKSRGAEDELNTIVAGTTTGLLYKCTGNFELYFMEDIYFLHRVLFASFCINYLKLIFFSAGMQKCLRAGGIGLGISTIYCLYTSQDRVKQMLGID